MTDPVITSCRLDPPPKLGIDLCERCRYMEPSLKDFRNRATSGAKVCCVAASPRGPAEGSPSPEFDH